MYNYLGAMQPVSPAKAAELRKAGRAPTNEDLEGMPRVCGKGRCENQADAKAQMRYLYKKEHPEYTQYVDDEHCCFGGVFVFKCSPFELIEKAADETSAEIIRKIYDDAIEVTPLRF